MFLLRKLFPTGDTYESQAIGPGQTSQRDPPKRTVSILLLGRSGSGKTFFVKTACAEEGRALDGKSIKSTVDVTSRAVHFSDTRFQFIDTPGFNHPAMSNLDVFTKLADYLLCETSLRAGIAGVVYIHRAGDPLEGTTFAQNLSVLFDVFLGDLGLSRLTIMVVPEKPGMQVPASVARALSQATVFRTALAKGAKVVVSILRQVSIDNILTSYASLGPVLLRVQQEGIRNLRAVVGAQIKGRLDRHEGGSTQLRNDAQIDPNLASYEENVHLLESSLNEKERKVLELSHAHEQLEQQLARSQEETLALSQQLQQTQKEYVSLRSQLQLHENVEQGDIVQTLKDLNRSIDDLARSISQYMVDTYSEAVFGREASTVTTLDALNLPDLKVLLGHVEGNSSLVASSGGGGMPIEDFLDYATRSSLCKHLFEAIFSPFHPAADSAHNAIVATIYDNVRRQEPQPVAAKWRASCFKGIHKPDNADTITHYVNLSVRQFVNGGLSPLFTCVFGEKAGVGLENQHLDRILQLFRTAWGWNSMLKGDVIMLGDFHLTYYAPVHRFDASLMREFESDPRKPPPNHILGTLGLGLLSSHAVGGGHTPEITVVLGATVATKSLYVQPNQALPATDNMPEASGVEPVVYRVTHWPGQEARSQQGRVPTLVWYDFNKKAVSFGAEALSRGAKDKAEDNGWQLAKHFKLHLHPDDMKAKHNLKLDPLPSGVSLHQVYSDFLAYLLKHTRSFFEDRIVDGRNLWETHSPNIEVVITHPNGWGIREQGFLRGVAVEAGFASASSPHKLRFVTEAEAIFHFSAHHTVLGSFLQIGANFAVCNAGGSTVDTTVYSLVRASPNLTLEEARASACIQAGAIFVDAAAERYIRSVLTEASLLDQEGVQDYAIRSVKNFNVVKRYFRDATGDMMIEISDLRFHNLSAKVRRGRMTIPGAVVKSFFDVCLDEIMASVDQQIRGLSTSLILLVGEFGDIPYVQQEFKARYEPQGCQVVTHTGDSTSKAAAEGAIIWSVASNANSREEPPVLHQKSKRPRSEYDSLLFKLQPQEDYFKELRLLDASMKEKESKLRELNQAHERLTRELTELCQQVKRVQGEHASLWSQLQLQENIGRSETVQTLKDLNRESQDAGRLISEYLTDTYVQKTFGKDPSDVTVLDAIYMPELKALLGHFDGRSSLVVSWDHEVAMPVEDFLDYAIRSLLCKHLCERIFTPFHPAINLSLNDAISAMYHDIQQQETQTVAGKWRTNCFKDVYKPRIPDPAAYYVGVLAREFVNSSLSPLLTCFFGEKAGVELENQQLDLITRLFRSAWDWNSVLKGEIVLQGDFHPTYYGPLHRFDPDVMTEFEPNPRKPQPEYILGTLALGLSCSHAVGGGKAPEKTVVIKATVATKSLYA